MIIGKDYVLQSLPTNFELDRLRLLTVMEFCLKSVHFGYVHSWLFALVKTRVHGKVLSLSYDAIVSLEQLILFFKG